MTRTPMSDQVTQLGLSRMVGFFEHDSDDWHVQRGKVIGASEIAGAADIVGAYHRRYMLYQIKNGLYTEPEPDEDLKRRFKAGHLAEHTLDGLLEEVFPDEIPFETGSWQHMELPWAGCNPDRLTWDPVTRTIGGREYKNTTQQWDWPPLKFVAQCEYTRGLLGLPQYTLAALISGWDVATWTIRPGAMRRTLVINNKTGESRAEMGVSFNELMRAGQEFVDLKEAPPVDGEDETYEFTKKLEDDVIDLGEDVQFDLALVRELHKYDRMVKDGTTGFNEARAKALVKMGNAKGAYIGPTRVAYRQAQKSGGAALYLTRNAKVKDLIAQAEAADAEAEANRQHDNTTN